MVFSTVMLTAELLEKMPPPEPVPLKELPLPPEAVLPEMVSLSREREPLPSTKIAPPWPAPPKNPPVPPPWTVLLLNVQLVTEELELSRSRAPPSAALAAPAGNDVGGRGGVAGEGAVGDRQVDVVTGDSAACCGGSGGDAVV